MATLDAIDSEGLQLLLPRLALAACTSWWNRCPAVSAPSSRLCEFVLLCSMSEGMMAVGLHLRIILTVQPGATGMVFFRVQGAECAIASNVLASEASEVTVTAL